MTDDDKHRRDVEADLAQLKRQEWGAWRAASERKYPTRFFGHAVGARAVNQQTKDKNDG